RFARDAALLSIPEPEPARALDELEGRGVFHERDGAGRVAPDPSSRRSYCSSPWPSTPCFDVVAIVAIVGDVSVIDADVLVVVANYVAIPAENAGLSVMRSVAVAVRSGSAAHRVGAEVAANAMQVRQSRPSHGPGG